MSFEEADPEKVYKEHVKKALPDASGKLMQAAYEALGTCKFDGIKRFLPGAKTYYGIVTALFRLGENGFFGEHGVPDMERRFGHSYEFTPSSEDLWNLLNCAKEPALIGTPSAVVDFVNNNRTELVQAFEMMCSLDKFHAKCEVIDTQFWRELHSEMPKTNFDYSMVLDIRRYDLQVDDPKILEAVEVSKRIENEADALKIRAWEQSLTEGKAFATKALRCNVSPFESKAAAR